MTSAAVLAGLPDLLRPLTVFYLDLHRHPELSGEERSTAGRFADRLEAAGYRTARGIGGHGVAGVLRRGAGPVVLLRAELDALPVRETTGLAYASEGDAAHACGHDLHLAAAAGAAELLARADAGAWRGTLVVVGQPAEETLEGARAMLADGLYERVGVPDVALAQHTAPLPAGMVAHGYGPMTAGSVTFRVVVHGRGGHAGAPHLTVDPVVTAAHVVTRLQTVVAREAAPSEQVAVTVGSLRAGERANVVPDRAELGITVRAAGDAALARAAGAVERIVRAECAASGCPRDPEIERVSTSPVTHPDPATTAAIRGVHAAKFGVGAVVNYFSKATPQPQPTQPGTTTSGGGERDGVFNLPPNIAFGVTALVNSSAQQTIEVFVDDNPKPAATFQGAGTQDANLNTQIVNSGKGKVRVVVTANGKPSKIGSRQVDIFKKTYFGLVGSEDGTDGDYNDGIAILNWPLG
ncbi:amidohydrolase [Streptomyces sp. NPDC055005]